MESGEAHPGLEGRALESGGARAGEGPDPRALGSPDLGRLFQRLAARGGDRVLCRGSASREHTIDPRLNEIHHGDWEGLSESDLPDLDLYRKWREDPTAVTLPGAEPLAQVHERALAAMRDIAAKHPASEGLVAVVSHQILLALLKC